MTHSEVDHSVFYRHTTHNLSIHLVVYVDEIVTMGNNEAGIIKLKQHIF